MLPVAEGIPCGERIGCFALDWIARARTPLGLGSVLAAMHSHECVSTAVHSHECVFATCESWGLVRLDAEGGGKASSRHSTALLTLIQRYHDSILAICDRVRRLPEWGELSRANKRTQGQSRGKSHTSLRGWWAAQAVAPLPMRRRMRAMDLRVRRRGAACFSSLEASDGTAMSSGLAITSTWQGERMYAEIRPWAR